jgi:hypothetical protein
MVYGICRKVHLWPYVNHVLLWFKTAKNWNSSTPSVIVSHMEFKENLFNIIGAHTRSQTKGQTQPQHKVFLFSRFKSSDDGYVNMSKITYILVTGLCLSSVKNLLSWFIDCVISLISVFVLASVLVGL